MQHEILKRLSATVPDIEYAAAIFLREGYPAVGAVQSRPLTMQKYKMLVQLFCYAVQRLPEMRDSVAAEPHGLSCSVTTEFGPNRHFIAWDRVALLAQRGAPNRLGVSFVQAMGTRVVEAARRKTGAYKP